MDRGGLSALHRAATVFQRQFTLAEEIDMPKPPKKSKRDTGGNLPKSPRELIVMMRSEAEVATTDMGMTSRSGMGMQELTDLLKGAGAEMHPLFGPTEDRVRGEMAFAATSESGDLATFYQVEADDGALDKLAEALAKTDPVAAAYVKPPSSPATMIEDVAPATETPPSTTPDFGNRQAYLDPAPGGINARWAWTQSGGRGRNVQLIDIEGAWRYTHEDLRANQGGVIGGVQSDNIRWRNHGTAVIGVYGGDNNAFGITGIASDANCRAYSIFGPGNSSAAAIRDAAQRLHAGDILLIELHRPGPRHNFAARDDQRGYIAIEWWPDDWAAIRFATDRGVIVVEAAGNGAENLDDAIYNTRPSGFPTSWRNPFDRANPDCRAVVVGAGAPPSGNHGPDRSRLDFSNHGACVDAQGYGREVCTTGYGDLQGGSNEDLWYTARFSGTSSASPIVVGALACVQGMLRARGATLLTPQTARARLRATGSPQTDGPGRPASQRIGNRPDIRGIWNALFPKTGIKDFVDNKSGKEVEKKADTKEVKDKPEKIEVKEVKDKPEKIEVKEVKDKPEKTEVKEFESEKRVFEKAKDTVEGGGKLREVFGGPSADPLEARVAAIEAHLAHFIGAELRPDVGSSVYGDESARLERLRQEAEAQLAAAKGAKDMKDAEV
jgi:hypothetical protein